MDDESRRVCSQRGRDGKQTRVEAGVTRRASSLRLPSGQSWLAQQADGQPLRGRYSALKPVQSLAVMGCVDCKGPRTRTFLNRLSAPPPAQQQGQHSACGSSHGHGFDGLLDHAGAGAVGIDLRLQARLPGKAAQRLLALAHGAAGASAQVGRQCVAPRSARGFDHFNFNGFGLFAQTIIKVRISA